jgi:hypothetical protein
MEISKNRKGSSTLCVFKTHYRDRRAAVAKISEISHLHADPVFGPYDIGLKDLLMPEKTQDQKMKGSRLKPAPPTIVLMSLRLATLARNNPKDHWKKDNYSR